MTSREIIRRVLAHDDPPRIGFTFRPYDGRPRLNDVATCGPAVARGFDGSWREDGAGGEVHDDEWGCTWRRVAGRTDKGEVVGPAITSAADVEAYQPPDLGHRSRYHHCAAIREAHANRYLLGSITGCCFNRARYLPGFATYLEWCAGEPELVDTINRMVSDIVLAQVDAYAEIGCDGVFFVEDWGTQERLLVSPAMWDRCFRWTFERLLERAHGHGLTVWMHSCGYIREIIPTLVYLGMDVFQFSQPEIHGLDFLAQYADRTTFWCSVDGQKTLPTGDEALIRSRAREMAQKLGHGGGFIARDNANPAALGVELLWMQWSYEEFMRWGIFDPAEAGLSPAEV